MVKKNANYRVYMRNIGRVQTLNLLLLIKMLLVIIGLLCTCWIGFSPIVAEGLESLFLLPLTFAVVCFFSQNAFIYAKDSYGLLILYTLIVLRYLITPLLIAASGTLVSRVSTSSIGLRYAVGIMIIELIVVTIAINKIWKSKIEIKVSSLSERFSLSWLGALISILLLTAIIARGTLSNVLEHLSFGNTYKFAYSDLKTYDMSALMTLKVFIFFTLVSWAHKKYTFFKDGLNRNFYFLFAVIVAFANAMIYEASNRTLMVINALASLSVLSYYFGKKITKFLPIIIVLGSLFVWALFAYGTLGVREGDSLLERTNYITQLSRVSELYSNGVSMEAHAYDMYDLIAPNINIYSYLSEFIKSNNIFTLPGFWVVRRTVDFIPSIQRLFNLTLSHGDAFILPNAGLAIYAGSKVFGLQLDIVFHWFIIYFMFYFHKKKKHSKEISKIYLYSYCEMIFGVALINNVMIAVSLLTAVPFLLYILIKLNELGKIIHIR